MALSTDIDQETFTATLDLGRLPRFIGAAFCISGIFTCFLFQFMSLFPLPFLLIGLVLFFAQRTVFLNRTTRQLQTWWFFPKLNYRFRVKHFSLPENAIIFDRRVERHSHGGGGGSSVTYQICLRGRVEGEYTVLFEHMSREETRALMKQLCRCSDSQIEFERQPSQEQKRKKQLKEFAIGAALFLGLIVLGAIPNPFAAPKPPEGVPTYVRDDGMICWDKTICCSDGSSCETITTCLP